ncbi:response regulator [candidate division KSB1 bacterium]
MAKVLVVDDSVIMRKNLIALIEKAGYEIAGEASNGNEAYDRYVKLMPELVTMDITMPEMDGIGAVEKIINEYPDAKIIMVSALGQKDMVLKAIKNGALNFIVKPVRLDVIKKVLNEVYPLELDDRDTVTLSQDSIAEDDADTSADTGKKEASGFDIQNQEGTFIIKLTGNLDDSDLKGLNNAVAGLLYVKPLKVFFDLENSGDLDEKNIKSVNSIVNQIKKAEGTLNVSPNGAKYIKQ